jgi:hypothetical protein
MSWNNIFSDFYEWLLLLPPDFMFLLSLPFLVALAGLLREFWRPPLDDVRGRPRRNWYGASSLSGEIGGNHLFSRREL